LHFRYVFPLPCQSPHSNCRVKCFPALLLLAGVKLLPDSPRYLAYAGRLDEAKEVLEHVRGSDDYEVEKEFAEICAVAEGSEPSSPMQFAKVLFGRATSAPHLGRRAWLCIWLQIMASWTGITAVTAYSPVVGPQSFPPSSGSHSHLLAPQASRLQLCQTERSCWWPQHNRHSRNYYLCLHRRPFRPPQVPDVGCIQSFHSERDCSLPVRRFPRKP
jgi:hypothetical protein